MVRAASGGGVELGILGALTIRSEGTEVPVGPPKLRALLTSLALDVGRVVPTDRLVDDLWGDAATDQALVSLRSYVSNLRRLLPGTPDRPVIATRGRGYVLDHDPDAVDVVRFERLARAGRDRLADDPVGALADLDAALALWRGPALADVADLAFARAPIARLDELRLAAIEDRLDALLAVGFVTEGVAEAEAHVAAHPLRERARGQLMLGLYRSGRAPDALAVHRDLRERLADELGLDPGPRVEALAEAILRRDPALDAPPPPRAARLPPAPVPVAGVEPGGLVGRAAELDRVEVVLDGLVAGSGGVLLVHGEPGIGKTALLRGLTRAAESRELPVVWGRCDEFEGAPAYWPWVQALRTLAERLSADVLDAALAGVGVPVATLVPDLAAGAPPSGWDAVSDPQAARFALHDAVATFLRRVAAPRGLVVVVDDLHWADLASLELLAFLAGQARGSRLLLAGSHRDAAADRTPELDAALGMLVREETARTIRLAPLGQEEVGRLVADVVGAPVPTDDARELHRRAGGNPFFVRQLAELRAETGATTGAVPVGVHQVLARRLQRLPDAVTRTLEAASVLGEHVDARPLADCLDLPLATVLEHLDVAVAHGLVEGGEGATTYHVAHALVRDTLRERLAPGRAARLHLAAADALERRDPPPAEAIAEHLWQAADLVDGHRPVQWLRTAAEEALQVFAPEQAEAALRRALHLLAHRPTGGEALELDVRLRLVQVLVGLHGWSASSVPEVADRARDLALRTGMVPEVTWLWWSRWAHAMTSGALGEADGRARQLLADAEHAGTPAEHVAGHVAVAYTTLFRAGPCPELDDHLAAAAAAEARADPAALAVTPERLPVARRITLAMTAALDGDADRAEAAVADAVAVGTRIAPFSEAYARMFGGFASAVVDRPERAVAWAGPGLELAARLSLPHLANLTTPTHAWARVRLGDAPADHVDRMRTAIDELLAHGHRHAVAQWRLLLAEVLAIAGDRAGAQAELAASRALADELGEVVYGPQWARVGRRVAGPVPA